jgi:hypothetical protein
VRRSAYEKAGGAQGQVVALSGKQPTKIGHSES